MLRGEWNAALLDELAAFPNGQHDDQVDACAGAFNGLTIGGVGRWEDLAGLGHIENFKSKWS
jgi:phage terminase large subunit-like protein